MPVGLAIDLRVLTRHDPALLCWILINLSISLFYLVACNASSHSGLRLKLYELSIMVQRAQDRVGVSHGHFCQDVFTQARFASSLLVCCNNLTCLHGYPGLSGWHYLSRFV